MLNSLANKLTLSRIAAIPVILILLALGCAWAAWIALVLFIAAGITDWLDGYMARRDNQVSTIGQFLDPIADKLLIAAVILFLVANGQIAGYNGQIAGYNGQITGHAIWPAVIILLREVAVSGLREFLAGVRVSVPVSQLAKWKTFLQIVALSFLIIGDRYAPAWIPATAIGDWGLWIAGVLTVFTAWDYWRASVRHFRD